MTTRMTLLEVVSAAVWGDEPGDDLAILREDARQVILTARAALSRPDAENPAAVNVPRVEAVITNLLPHCEARLVPTRANATAKAIVAHARELVSGTHTSRNYPARRRLRILLYSASRLLARTRAGPPTPPLERPLVPPHSRRLTVCQHHPACPSAEASDRESAKVKSSHPEQGWRVDCTIPPRRTVTHHRRDGA